MKLIFPTNSTSWNCWKLPVRPSLLTVLVACYNFKVVAFDEIVVRGKITFSKGNIPRLVLQPELCCEIRKYLTLDLLLEITDGSLIRFLSKHSKSFFRDVQWVTELLMNQSFSGWEAGENPAYSSANFKEPAGNLKQAAEWWQTRRLAVICEFGPQAACETCH